VKTMLKRLSIAALFVALLAPCSLRVHAQDSGAQTAPAKAGEQTTPAAQVPEKRAEEKDENDAYRYSPTVIKLGAMLGMSKETASTVFTLFNLLVLVIAVAYFLAKALPKAFRNRSTDIQKKLVDARTATEEATARLNTVEARLSKLDDQIAGFRTQAEADSKRYEQRIKANIEEEKGKILAAAEQEIAAATTHAQRQIQQYAAELAIEHAARKLIVSAETDRLLVESFAHRLGGDKGGQN
jgi:F-type H+-transporting ATPase subunit b